MILPKQCVVDTNVPMVANLSAKSDPGSDVPPDCVMACVKAVGHVIEKQGLILDKGNEIFSEYLKNLRIAGQPGVGDGFMKWVHDNLGHLYDCQGVNITKNGDSYDEFPAHEGLKEFDRSDRKFVAVANAHDNKPPILQATDSKWWGWKDALADEGITVRFLCQGYVEAKYAEKMGK